jgi:hypothetical protein
MRREDKADERSQVTASRAGEVGGCGSERRGELGSTSVRQPRSAPASHPGGARTMPRSRCWLYRYVLVRPSQITEEILESRDHSGQSRRGGGHDPSALGSRFRAVAPRNRHLQTYRSIVLTFQTGMASRALAKSGVWSR